MGANSFYEEHATLVTSVAAAMKTVEVDVSRLPAAPTRSQLATLAAAVAHAHASLERVSSWKIAGQGEEGAEEEDVPRAETQVAEGAEALIAAMSALQVFARTPSANILTHYDTEFANGRISWNEGVFQLWYLAHKSNPPKL